MLLDSVNLLMISNVVPDDKINFTLFHFYYDCQHKTNSEVCLKTHCILEITTKNIAKLPLDEMQETPR